MLEQMLCIPAVPTLSALLTHPEFREGLEFGRLLYDDLAYEGRLTEDEMITLVEGELSRRARQQEARHARMTTDPTLSFLLHLGVVVGAIEQGLLAGEQDATK